MSHNSLSSNSDNSLCNLPNIVSRPSPISNMSSIFPNTDCSATQSTPLLSNLLLLNALSSSSSVPSSSTQSLINDPLELLKTCYLANNLIYPLNTIPTIVQSASSLYQREQSIVGVDQTMATSSKPLTSAAKRRHRRKRNQMKRYALFASTVAASILGNNNNNNNKNDSKVSDHKSSLPNHEFNQIPKSNHNSLCNHSNNDHFYNYCNASSVKIKSRLRYVINLLL